MEYDIDSLVSDIDFNSNKLSVIGKNLMLTNKEIEILNRYKINYKKCNSLKEVLFEIEDIISDMDIVEDDTIEAETGAGEQVKPERKAPPSKKEREQIVKKNLASIIPDRTAQLMLGNLENEETSIRLELSEIKRPNDNIMDLLVVLIASPGMVGTEKTIVDILQAKNRSRAL